MGRQYYCEYCDKSFVETTDSVKKHRNGLVHQKLFKEHYSKLRDKSVILSEESSKNPCTRFFSTGECNFGALCRYSHYSKEDLDALRWEVHQGQIASSWSSQESDPSLFTWFKSRRRRGCEDSAALQEMFLDTMSSQGADLADLMSWTYPQVLDTIPDLPPSLKRMRKEDFANATFSEWG